MTKRTLFLAGIAALAILPSSAYAEDVAADEAAAGEAASEAAGEAPAAAATDSSGKLPENVIIITARRRDEQAQEVPLAIGVLDQRTINDTGASTIYKIQQLAPSLQVYSQNPRNTVVNIRGIGAPFGLTNDGFEQGVGVYIDDVYNARVASAVFDFLDVAQVEVLRGPQGTLYGKNTTAGAINIRTNQPTFDYEGSAEVTLGDYNFKQAKLAVSGPLSSTLAARVAVSATNRKGTIFNVTSNNWVNEQDNLGFRGQLLWRPTDDVDITLAGDWSDQHPECCASVFVGYGQTQRAAARQYPALAAQFGYAPPSLDGFDRLTDLNSSLNAGTKIGGLSLRAVWDIGDNDALTSITAWRFWDWKPENDRDYLGLDIVHSSNNPSQQDQYSQEFRWNHDGEQFDFVLGAFAFNQRIDTQGIESQGADSSKWNLTGAAATHPEYLDGLTALNTQWLKSTSLALFGQLSWHVTDRFTIQPGARLNYDKKEGHYERAVYTPQGTDLTCPQPSSNPAGVAQCGIYSPQLIEPEFSDWNFSYDLTLSYQLADDVLLYGTYAKTFKTGGINQNGVPTDAAGNPILDAATILPESVQHFEAGLKTQFWDHRATFNLAVFRTTIDDFQANVTNGQYGVLRGYLANADQVRTQGVEVDFSVRPSERFTAYANGAYTDAKYTSFCDAPTPPELSGGTVLPTTGECTFSGTPSAPGTPGGSSPPFYDASGEVLPGVSEWAFSYGAEANTPATLFGKNGEVDFGVDGNYRSKFSSNPTPSVYSWIDGYNLTALRAGFRGDGFNIYGWVRNVFNADYYDQLLFGPSNTGVIAGFPGDPRIWGGTIRFDF